VLQIWTALCSANDKWHLDEMFVTINGQRYYLWRAIDCEGMVLDILMQTRCNAKAAKRFFEGVLGKTSPIRVLL
jgi:putative transposase